MRDINLLHPKAKEKALQLQVLCANAGLPLLITETLRTIQEQDALFAQGRTKPGAIVTNAPGSNYSSNHQWGIAFDFCRNIRGREYDDSDGFFKKVADLAKSLGGISWGGDWTSPVDKPHLQLSEFSPDGTSAWLKRNYGIPENFMRTWAQIEKEDDDMTPERFKELLDAEIKSRKYNTIEELPSWAIPTIKKLQERGLISGTGDSLGISALTEDFVKSLVVVDRAGLFDISCIQTNNKQ